MSENLPEVCRQRLAQGLKQLAIALPEQATEQLLTYVALLVKWNKAYNLTAVRDAEQMVIRHLLDSLSVLPMVAGQDMLDVGSGGGMPGIILAICNPETNYTLLDSNGKKTRFLQQAKTQLQLSNVEVIQSRAENYSPPELFDRIISRAFTALDNMIGWCGPLLSEQGLFVAMKGTYPEPEQKPIPVGWEVKDVQSIDVPFIDEQRHLVSIGRIASNKS